MTEPLSLGLIALRTVVALGVAVAQSRREGALFFVLQALSDGSLAVGALAYADPGLGTRLGPWLVAMVAYALIWEVLKWVAYPAAASADQRYPPGQLFWIWESFGVLVPLLMGAIATSNAVPDYEADAVFGIVLGVAIIFFQRYFSVSQFARRLLNVLGVAIILVALWALQ